MYLGLHGNEQLHNSSMELLTSGRKVDNILSSVCNQTEDLKSTLANRIRSQLVELANTFNQPASNETASLQFMLSLQMAQENVSIAENAMADIREPLMQVTLSSVLSVIEMTRLNLRNHIDLLKTPRFFLSFNRSRKATNTKISARRALIYY